MHKRANDRDFVQDNCCMCGVGTFRLQTGVKERDILYVNFQNKVIKTAWFHWDGDLNLSYIWHLRSYWVISSAEKPSYHVHDVI